MHTMLGNEASYGMHEQKLLVVDDDPENRNMLAEIFSAEYEIVQARNGLEALDMAVEHKPHLVLLDILMPGMDGFQTCLRLRRNKDTQNIPIIFLTSKTEPESETFGLELGADDFVMKPFNNEVLRARVKRRLSGGGGIAPGEETTLGDCIVQWERQEVLRGKQRIPLTAKEIGMLRLFVENQGRVLTRETILDRVWSEHYITDRTIDSHIKELRKKIPPLVKMLKTVYGSGYRLDI